VKNGRYFEIPPSETTRGHGTSGDAKYYKDMLAELLNGAPGQ
jgi:homoserine O-acetyltransferase